MNKDIMIFGAFGDIDSALDAMDKMAEDIFEHMDSKEDWQIQGIIYQLKKIRAAVTLIDEIVSDDRAVMA